MEKQKKEKKKYKIKTLQNMIDCTNDENIDNFLIDLRSLLSTAHMYRDKLGWDNLEVRKFIWYDNNRHDAEILLGTKINRSKPEDILQFPAKGWGIDGNN